MPDSMPDFAATERTSKASPESSVLASRRRDVARLVAFIEAVVSPPRLAIDGVVVFAVAGLGLAAHQLSSAIPLFLALAAFAAYAVVRIGAARRAAVVYVKESDENPPPVPSHERPDLAAEFTWPCDARTLAELDAIVRMKNPAVQLRVRPWIGLMSWLLALGAPVASFPLSQTPATLTLCPALWCIAAAAMVSTAAWSMLTWANQRATDAIFAQAQLVLAVGGLPAGELPGDAAIRLADDGTAVLIRERLRRGFRPRARPAPRPPIAPAIVITGTGLVTAMVSVALFAT